MSNNQGRLIVGPVGLGLFLQFKNVQNDKVQCREKQKTQWAYLKSPP